MPFNDQTARGEPTPDVCKISFDFQYDVTVWALHSITSMLQFNEWWFLICSD